MKIEKVDPKKIEWNKLGRRGVYAEIYKAIDDLKMGEAIRVVLDKENKTFNNSVYQSYRQSRAPFLTKMKRMDEKGKIWIIQKKERKNI